MTLQRTFALGAILLGFWLGLSGHFDPRMVGFGVGSVALVLFVAVRMRVVDEEGVPLHMGVRFWLYLPWLMKEVFVSNVRVAKIILDPRLPISPVVVHFRASQKNRRWAGPLRQLDYAHARHDHDQLERQRPGDPRAHLDRLRWR